jgi:hypothetical protein
MKIDKTATKLSVTKNEGLLFLLTAIVVALTVTYPIIHLHFRAYVKIIVPLIPLVVVTIIPYSHTVILDKTRGTMTCIRRAFAYAQRKEIPLGQIRSVTTGYSVWHDMSKVVALVGFTPVAILTAPDSEVYEAVAVMNEFLKGVENGAVIRLEKMIAEKDVYTGMSRLPEKLVVLFFVSVGSLTVVLTFLRKVAPRLSKLPPTVMVGIILFFLGTVYFLYSGVFVMYKEKFSGDIRFKIDDPTTHLLLSLLLVLAAIVLFFVGILPK